MKQYPTDLELVHQFQTGEEKAFDLLIEKHKHFFMNYALKISHDYDDAKDIVQTMMIGMSKTLKKINTKEESFFLKYAKRSIKNNYITITRKNKECFDFDSNYLNQNEIPFLTFEMEYYNEIAFKELSDIEYKIYIEYFINNKNIELIYKELGLTKSKAYRSFKSLKDKLKTKIGNEG